MRPAPRWMPYLDLACAVAAGALWYALPGAGAWPLVLALAPWLLRMLLTRRAGRRTPFDLSLVLFVVTGVLGVWSAFDRQAALSKFWLIVGGVLLYYALANAEPLGEGRLWFLALFGAAVALYFLATHNWETYPAKIPGLTELGRALQAPLPELPGHRLHPNVAGGIMAMMLPFSLSLAAGWRRQRWPARLLATGCAGLALFGLLMTTSRGAWIALAAALLLAGLWGLAGRLSAASAAVTRGRGKGEMPRRRAAGAGSRVLSPGWLFAGMVAALAALGAAAALLSPSLLTAVLGTVALTGAGEPRLELMGNTLTLVRDYAFLGGGLGGFMMLYSTYVLLLHVGFSVHSHNLLLDVAVEQGLPALGILIAAWLIFAALVVRALRQRGPAAAALGAAALSLLVVLVHGQVDDALYGSRAVLLLFVPLAFAVRSSDSPVPSPWHAVPARARPRLSGLPLWGPPVAVLLLLGTALLSRRPLLSRLYSNLAAIWQSQIELSVYSWPDWPVQDSLRRALDLSRPVAGYHRALALDPDNVSANRRLGQIELSLGDYEAALSHLGAAHASDPASEANRRLLGEAYLVTGHREEGAALWATVSSAQRQSDGRAWWYRSIGETERAEWLEQAIHGQ